jgi:NTE family protein
MSSGFFSFFAHTGMLESLLSTGHNPRLVSGSSAGALVGGAYAAGLAPRDLGARLLRLRRDEFWDPALGAGLLRGGKFDRLLREMLPVADIERAHVPLAISAFDIKARTTHVLRAGDLSAAIRASCAVPALFHPVPIGVARTGTAASSIGPAWREFPSESACCFITSRRSRRGGRSSPYRAARTW